MGIDCIVRWNGRVAVYKDVTASMAASMFAAEFCHALEPGNKLTIDVQEISRHLGTSTHLAFSFKAERCFRWVHV